MQKIKKIIHRKKTHRLGRLLGLLPDGAVGQVLDVVLLAEEVVVLSGLDALLLGVIGDLVVELGGVAAPVLGMDGRGGAYLIGTNLCALHYDAAGSDNGAIRELGTLEDDGLVTDGALVADVAAGEDGALA